MQLLNAREKAFRPHREFFSRKRSRRQPAAFARWKGDGILIFRLHKKKFRAEIRQSPRSGRTKIAQRFIAGRSQLGVSVREADVRGFVQKFRSPVSRARNQLSCGNPSTKGAGLYSFVRCAVSKRKIVLIVIVIVALNTSCSAVRNQNPPLTTEETHEVTDEAGRRVSLPLKINRIVSLAPNLTEIVYGVGAGDRLVGDTDYCDYPAEARNVTKIGDTMHPSIERIIALKPQIVLVSTASQLENFTRQLNEQKIAVYVTNPHSLEEIFRSIETLGDLFGQHNEATRLAGDLRRRTQAVEQALARSKPVKVFYQVSGEPLYTIGRDAYLTDLVKRAGGTSVTAEVPTAFPRFSDEAALASRPEAIILPTGGSMGTANSTVAAALKNSPALLNNRVYRINDDHLSRPGPRLVDGLEEMARALHPEAFK